MREIKYRGKRKDNGEWIYGHYFIFRGCKDGQEFTQHLIGDLENHEEVDPETVGQFTGLYDKNGKEEREIYEGDAYRGAESGIILVVEFREGEFMLTRNDDRSPYYRIKHADLYYALHNLNLIYIGPIHENPDLLEK